MTVPFRPTLQRLQPGAELARFKTNAEILAAWERDAAARCANITVGHRHLQIRRFMEQWGTVLITELNVPELRSYIEVYATGCRNFRRGGLTPGPHRPPMPDRCHKGFDLAGCGTKCRGYEAMHVVTVEKHLEALKDLYDYLVELGLLPFNLLEQAKKSWKKRNKHRFQRKGKKRHLSQEELLALFHGTDDPDVKAIIGVGSKTGVRIGEIGRLRVDDRHLDPHLTWMRLPPKKNGGKRKGNDYLIIDNELRRILVPYLAWRKAKLQRIYGREDAVPELIINRLGKPLPEEREGESINRRLQEIGVRLGLQRPDAERGEAITSHCLRRYFSNACMKNGLWNTRLEILRGDVPKNKNEYDYGEFTEEDIRTWYNQYAPIIGF